MLIALPLAVVAVAAVAWRHADGPGGRRLVLIVAALRLVRAGRGGNSRADAAVARRA